MHKLYLIFIIITLRVYTPAETPYIGDRLGKQITLNDNLPDFLELQAYLRGQAKGDRYVVGPHTHEVDFML